MLHAGLDGEDALDVDAGGPDTGQGLGRDAAASGVGLAHRNLHPEPRLVLCDLAPDAPHGGPRVPLDHAHTLMQNRSEWKPGLLPATTGRTFRAPALPAQSNGWGEELSELCRKVPAVQRAERGERELLLVDDLADQRLDLVVA